MTGKEISMEPRLNYFGNTVAAKFAKYINSAGAVVTGSTLPAIVRELAKVRASQINGCAACTDMHTKDAEHAGETSLRLKLIAVWRDAKVFTEAEKAALELTEQGTRVADAADGVTDEAWLVLSGAGRSTNAVATTDVTEPRRRGARDVR